MPVFPSEEWARELVKVAQEDEEFKNIAKTWKYGPILAVLEPDDKFNQKYLMLFSMKEDGTIDVKPVSTESEVKPEVSLIASYSTWKSIVKGEVDPVQEYMKGKIKAQGNFMVLFQYLRFMTKFMEILRKVPTEFADEKEVR